MPREPEPLDDLPSTPLAHGDARGQSSPELQPKADSRPKDAESTPPKVEPQAAAPLESDSLPKVDTKGHPPAPPKPETQPVKKKGKAVPVAWVAAFFLGIFLLAMLARDSSSGGPREPVLSPEETRIATAQFQAEASHYFQQFLELPLPASADDFDLQGECFVISSADAELLRSAMLRAEKNWDKSRLKLPPHGLQRQVPGEGTVTSVSFVPRFQSWHPESEEAADFESTRGLHLVISLNEETNEVQVTTSHPGEG